MAYVEFFQKGVASAVGKTQVAKDDVGRVFLGHSEGLMGRTGAVHLKAADNQVFLKGFTKVRFVFHEQ